MIFALIKNYFSKILRPKVAKNLKYLHKKFCESQPSFFAGIKKGFSLIKVTIRAISKFLNHIYVIWPTSRMEKFKVKNKFRLYSALFWENQNVSSRRRVGVEGSLPVSPNDTWRRDWYKIGQKILSII